MLESILMANTGLSGHQKALKTISDNVANINTPGYKGSRVQFSDLFLAQGGDASGDSSDQLPGGGVQVLGTTINFATGELRDTGRALDTAINGSGFFVLENTSGQRLYTKTGRFQFNKDDQLVTLEQGYKVKGINDAGQLVDINMSSLKTYPSKATTKVTFTGNLSAGDTNHVISDITVYDLAGVSHKLELTLLKQDTLSSTWSASVTDTGTTLVPGTDVIVLPDGADPTASEISVNIKTTDGRESTVVLTLGDSVTGRSQGTSSTLEVLETDGYGPGQPDVINFDKKGVLNVKFTNGKSSQGAALALAEFASLDDLSIVSGAMFAAPLDAQIRYVHAGNGSTVQSGTLELSNVDLTDQFSDMVLVQRGYQASSQVLSTANEMIQDLLDMKGRR